MRDTQSNVELAGMLSGAGITPVSRHHDSLRPDVVRLLENHVDHAVAVGGTHDHVLRKAGMQVSLKDQHCIQRHAGHLPA